MAGQTYGQGTIDSLNARLALATKERDALAALCSPDGLERLKAELAGVAALKAEAEVHRAFSAAQALRLHEAEEVIAAYESLARAMEVKLPLPRSAEDIEEAAARLKVPEGPHTLADVDAALGQALRAEPAAVPPAVSQAMAEADRLLKQYPGRSDTMPSAGAQPAEAGAIEGEPKRDVEVEISRREGQRPTVYDRTKSDKKHR